MGNRFSSGPLLLLTSSFRFQFLRMLGCSGNDSLNNLEKAHKIQKTVRKRTQKTSKIVWALSLSFSAF